MTVRQLVTRHGMITFPTFMPVTTFGGKYPLDDLVRPYLRRFAQCVMVSYHYAKQMKPQERPKLPLFIDSGGFASLFKGSQIVDEGEYASIRTKEGDLISPPEVLAFQEKHADIGATLDFIVPPGMDLQEARYRQAMTVKNAIWALRHRQRKDLCLFASVQAWDEDSANQIMQQLVDLPFGGFALGGMVPRIQTPKTIISIVKTIRQIEVSMPLHLFGIGHPQLISELLFNGVDSTDSSAYVRSSVDKKYYDQNTGSWSSVQNYSEEHCCDCRSCQLFGFRHYILGGESNSLGLTLHNLSAIAI